MNAWNGGSHGRLHSNPPDQINENNITPDGMNSVPLQSGQDATAGENNASSLPQTAGGMYGIHLTSNISNNQNPGSIWNGVQNRQRVGMIANPLGTVVLWRHNGRDR